jgi:hypothetical protein
MLPPAILIGYCAKKVEKRPEWLEASNLEGICSVSHCISRPPEAYWEWHPALNAAWLYRNETDALGQFAPTEDPKDFDLFAYRILPIGFGDEGEQLPLQEHELSAITQAAEQTAALPDDYDFLGYDCPNKAVVWGYSGFDCSPLSCNSMSETIAVNRHCLIDERERAIAVAERFAKEDMEAAYVVEVWRKRRIPA